MLCNCVLIVLHFFSLQDEESDGEDFDPEDGDDDDVDISDEDEEEEEASGAKRGEKRKLIEENEADSASGPGDQ